MAMLFDVLTRPIVVATGANVMRFEDAAADGVYSVTIAAGTYDTLAALLLEVQGKAQSASAAFGLSLDWQFIVTLNVNDYRPTILIEHDGAANAFIRVTDALHTLPDLFGLNETPDVTVLVAGNTYQFASEHVWISPQPVYSVDEDPSEVDVMEMVTPSGRSFRAKNSDVRRLRALSLRNLPRDRTLETGNATPLAALESFWERTIIEDWRRYHPALATYPALAALASGNFVGAYRWTGSSLTGFTFRRASVQRVPLYDVDLAAREVVP